MFEELQHSFGIVFGNRLEFWSLNDFPVVFNDEGFGCQLQVQRLVQVSVEEMADSSLNWQGSDQTGFAFLEDN